MADRKSVVNSVHFACFACRKGFKQPDPSDGDRDGPERPIGCPDCKQPMVRLGRYFKAPRKQATREWLKVELLYVYGERFEAGNSRLAQRCPTLPAAVAHLIESGHPADGVQKALKAIRARRTNPDV